MKKNINKKILIIAGCIIALTSCGAQPVKNQSDDSAVIDDEPIESVISKVDESEVKPIEVKKIAPIAEESLIQAIKKQNENEIVKSANDLLMSNPTNLKALNALGLLNYKKGKYKTAEFFLNKALKTHSDESGLFNNLALVKLAENDQREAVKLLKSGLALKSNDKVMLTNLGAIYSKQKDFQNAELSLESVYKGGSKDIKACTNYAVALAANKKINEASEVYKKLLAENSSSREIMLNYSIHLVENVKDYKQGLELINRLKFVGVPDEARNIIKELENKAKAGLK